MKVLKITFMAILLWVSGKAQQHPEPKLTDMQLSISIKKRLQAQAVVVNVEFKNTTPKEIRLVDGFRSDMAPAAYLTMNIKRLTIDPPEAPGPDGTSRLKLFRPPLALGGLLDPPLGGFRYITIKPGRSFKYVYNVSKVLGKSNYVLPEGEYEFYIIYGNDYGEDCIKGYGYESNKVNFTVVK